LGAPRRRPCARRAAAPERVLLRLGQPRAARLDHRRVDDLPTHRQPAFLAQQRVEPGEQIRRRAGPRELLAKQPDRPGVGERIVQRQPDEPHERQPAFS
jgi:hypothetical protein